MSVVQIINGLIVELDAAVTMLMIEAKSHEDSGDEQRRRYVTPLREQIARGRSILACAKGE